MRRADHPRGTRVPTAMTRATARIAIRTRVVVGAACAAALLVIACAIPTEPRLPTGATLWTAPARFALWWRMTEACSGRSGDFRSVQWYIVPGVRTIEVQGEHYDGFWFGQPNRIVLAEASSVDGPLVRHEMLHALLGVDGHPRDPFLTACDGVVTCDGGCAVEAGGRALPPSDAAEISPHDVATRIEIAPREPAESLDSGAVAVTVSITNPRDEAVWIRLEPQAPGDPFSHTFGVAADYDEYPDRVFAYSYSWIEGARFPLGARETRRFVWDNQLMAGRYAIRGFFNTDTAARVVLTVGR